MQAPSKTVRELRKMAGQSDEAMAFFGWLAEYQNSGTNTLDHAEREASKWARANIDRDLEVTRQTAIEIMKKMDFLKLGKFIVGRRGGVTRFEFWTNRGQIGQAAIGKISSINEDEEMSSDEIIDVHRRLIAHALGKSLDEITITYPRDDEEDEKEE